MATLSRKERRKVEREKSRRQEQEVKQKRHPLLEFYDKKYKKLMIIPFLILFLAIMQISYQYVTTGDFMEKGVSLKGGVTITVPYEAQANILDMESSFSKQFKGLDLNIRELAEFGATKALIFEADVDVDQQEKINDILSFVEQKTGVKQDLYGIETIGSSLSKSFFLDTMRALLIAFALMGIVVFITFRNFSPSLAVIFAAFSDIVETLAVTNLLNIKISAAGIAAFLMLIGYSVDTDVLLSTRVLKRKSGEVIDRVMSSMKTGMLMTGTTLVAVTVGLFIGESQVLKEIFTIILIGLLLDIPNTWIQNVGFLRIHLERKNNVKN